MVLTVRLTSSLRSGRRLANARMRATVRIEDVTTGTRDPLTGRVEPTLVYEGPARFRSYEAAEADFESAGASLSDQSHQMHVPWDAAALHQGYQVTCTSDPDNPRNVGALYRVEARLGTSQITAQRYRVSEVSS